MDRPIIFSRPMVKALLEGRKTQTRRILKPQPVPFKHDDGKECDVGLLHIEGAPCPRVTLGRVVIDQEVRYAIGDRLWVRENFAHVGTCDPGFLTYQATYPDDLKPFGIENVPATLKEAGYKWKPCIHMPRAISRLTLIVTGVKVERVQDISNEDAIAEGVGNWRAGWSQKEAALAFLRGTEAAVETREGTVAQRLFYLLWTTINGEESWKKNPFVVAITFRIIKANIDAPEARAAA